MILPSDLRQLFSMTNGVFDILAQDRETEKVKEAKEQLLAIQIRIHELLEIE